MKMCPKHWQMCRDAIESRGLEPLVAKSGEAAVDNAVSELQGGPTTFDPLMSMNTFFWGEALRCGGLYLMGQNETGENDGHYCPVCEFEKNMKGFDAEETINATADQMRAYAISQKLIPGVS